MTRVNVGKLEAGTGRNIVPGNAALQLETRGATTELNNYMKQAVFEKIKGTAKMYDIDATYSIAGEGISATADTGWHDRIIRTASSSDFIKDVQEAMPFQASEDVTHMMNHVQQVGGKSVFMLYGTPLTAGHHHASFDFDENTLPVALSVLTELTWQLNNKENL